MAFFGIRFDFRNPPFASTTMHERYQAALDMIGAIGSNRTAADNGV